MKDKIPFVAFVLVLLVQPAFANTTAQLKAIDLGSLHGQTLLESEHQQTPVGVQLKALNEVDWKHFSQADLNQGITDQAHWLRFYAQNNSEEVIDWVIRGETSYLDNLQIFYRTRNNFSHTGSSPHAQSSYQHIKLSDHQQFQQRQLDYRTLSFRLKSPANTTTEVILLAYYDKADSLGLRFNLYHYEDFQTLHSRENLLFGLFYGALLIIILLALLFAFLLRQPNAIYYALFITASVLFWLMLNGLGFQYLWPALPGWHNEGFHVVYLIFCITALQFSRTLLSLPKLFPNINRIFVAFQVLCGVGIALRLFGLYGPVLNMSFVSLGLLALLIPFASFLAWRRGVNYAIWCFLAWLFYSVGLLLSLACASISHIGWGMSSLAWLQLATVLESLFLLTAMSLWVVKLELSRKQALALAHQDHLTGLGNRRQLQSAYQEYLERFQNTSQPLYIIMIDLDYFKRINDTFGHDAGDKVLKDLSKLIRKNCRTQDVAIRFGGEEFALLLSLESLDQAWHVAERLRQQFESTPTSYDGQLIHHTLSCGIAEVLSNTVQLDVNAMMRCADEALYQAKEAGRNLSYLYQNDSATSAEPETDSAFN
jgi:diguanylate cyclase (GGDEF)-like protein